MATKKMTRAAILAEIEKRINEILAERLANIDQYVNERVDKIANDIIANSLGFVDCFGRVRVDHDNHRAPPVAEAIGKRALALISGNLDTWLQEEFPGGRVPRKWLKPIKEEMVARMHDTVRLSLAGKSRCIADRLLADVLASLEPQTKREPQSAPAQPAVAPPQ